MAVGSQVGAYRIIDQIGEGGMGSVWLAEHMTIGRRAAVKMLHGEYSNRQEIVQRFFNEARAATQVNDPGIVQIFDFGTTPEGRAYIVMELLDGEPLDRRLQRHGKLSVHDALRIMRQVASTLGAAHARGIVHRDLKPENIFLVRDPEVPGGERAKILDFGIAKLSDSGGVKTQTNALMGTPMYMSPEQCRGAGHVDARSDVYALGCVMFALLTGMPPFVAEGHGELIVMHLQQPPPLVSSQVSHVPAAVDALVMKCLAKNPGDRFASGTELAHAIAAMITSTSQPGVSAQVPAHAQATIAIPTPTTLSGAAAQATGTVPPVRRGNGALIALGVVVLLATAGGVAFLAVGGKQNEPAAASEPARGESGTSTTSSGGATSPAPAPSAPAPVPAPAAAPAQVAAPAPTASTAAPAPTPAAPAAASAPTPAAPAAASAPASATTVTGTSAPATNHKPATAKKPRPTTTKSAGSATATKPVQPPDDILGTRN